MGKCFTGILALLFSVMIAGCATAEKPTEETKAADVFDPSAVKVTTFGNPGILAPGRGERVYVVAKDAEKLRDIYREIFRKEGFIVVDSREEADFEVGVAIDYYFTKVGASFTRVNIGELLDEYGTEVTVDGSRTNLGVLNTDLGTIWAGRGLSLGTHVGFSLVDMILRSTGVSGAINKAIAGDERGSCLGNCTNWHKYYTQSVMVGATVRGKIGGKRVSEFIRATALYKKLTFNLFPNELLEITTPRFDEVAFGAGKSHEN